MKNKVLVLLAVTAVVCAFMCVCVNAEFTKAATFTDGMFSDVPSTEWYASSVKDAYEFGIMNGVGASLFNPDGTLTVAEGITIASRIHQTMNGTAIADAEGEWYQKYVNYAVASGFMTDGQFDSYDRNIKRYEIASLLADVCGELGNVNSIDGIPDVSVTEPYEKKILKLYRAGILTGNDSYGTFAPFTNLKRSEISAMAVRIADSTKRVSKTFDVVDARTFTDAYGIVEVSQGGGRYGIANSWKYDNRFDYFNREGRPTHALSDTEAEKHVAIYRDFAVESEGIINTELAVSNLKCADNGVYISFLNPDGKEVALITRKNGKAAVVGTETLVSEFDISETAGKQVEFDITLDLDKNKCSVKANNVILGTVSISDEPVSRLAIGTTKEGTGSVTFQYCKMFKNYVLCEHFVGVNAIAGMEPAGWTVNNFKIERIVSGGAGYDYFSIKTDAKAGSTSTATKSFDPVTGKFYFQTYVLLPKKTDGAKVALMGGGNEVFTFTTKNGKFFIGDTELYDYTDNVWYLLSLDADTNTGLADIKINGKKKATVNFTSKIFDGVNVSFAPSEDAVMWFDDVELYPLVDHYDYPSTPVSTQTDDYNIGINVCYLWRDSNSAEGWDATSAFPEFDTYLGFYDEGARETADWETKWMVEHGIDFMHVCWYPHVNNISAPIKKHTRSYEAIHDGYMNSKYSDMLDFCIMWENGGNGIDGFENFKEYIWKYWKEYYFSDPRYARLDNMAVLSVWNKTTLLNSFKTPEGVKEAMDFMDAELKKMGYDGLILLFATQNGDYGVNYFNENASFGGDATYGYHWNTMGYSADYQINGMKKLRATAGDIQHTIPTVSVGFNSIGRHDTRYPIITAQDHLKVCEFIKEELSTYNTGTWKDKTLFVSTWNEFSEGTYVFPTASTGWNLLENIRRTFTNSGDDHSAFDVLPTEAQKARVNRMYPPHHAPIRRYRLEDANLSGGGLAEYDTLASVIKYDMADGGADAWMHLQNIPDYKAANGMISGTSISRDNSIVSNGNFVPFNASEVPYIHLCLKTSTETQGELFFITEDDGKWGNDKKISFDLRNKGEFTNYYIKLADHEKYKGKITAVRFDPQTAENAYFELIMIEFLGYTAEMMAAKPSVSVNGYTMTLIPDIQVADDGDYVVSAEARPSGFYSIMRLYYEWDRFTDDGILTLKTYDDVTAVLKVGSDKALVNGVEKPLGFTLTFRDGLPVFHMKKLCDVLGYEYTMDGGRMEIKTAEGELYDYLVYAAKNPAAWFFDIDGEIESWGVQNGSYVVEDGHAKIAPTNADPALYRTVSYNAEAFNTITVRVKYNDTMSEEGVEAPLLFFMTSADTGYAAARKIIGEYAMETLKDGYVDVYFFMPTNTLYTGEITGIRFDPYNRNTPFEVDYIKLENRDKRYTAAENEAIAILMSDEGYTQDKEFSFECDGTDMKYSSVMNCKCTYENGFLKVNPTAGDNAIRYDVAMNCDDYRRVVVGVKYVKGVMDTNIPEFYFITEADTAWNKKKLVQGRYVIPANAKQGDVIRIIFDLESSETFTGTLKTFRFDAYNKDTPFEIDYIRFFK